MSHTLHPHPPALPARSHHGRRHGLLVHRRLPQAVVTGAYRAVEFIKRNIKLDTEATSRPRWRTAEGGIASAQYAQRYAQHLLASSSVLWPSFFEPFFFIGYLISIALFGLYQAIFMANADETRDSAKKIVETDLKRRSLELHAATVVGSPR